MIGTYPHAPGFKEHGGCSQEAAELMRKSGKAGRLRVACLSRLRDNPLGRTGDELAWLEGVNLLNIRPRLSELRNNGLIAKHGSRNKLSIWRITDAGRSALQDVEKTHD